MEIKVGEYVRTKQGNIYKYTDEIKNDIQLQDFILCNKGKAIKHSPNIIDLIEEEDIAVLNCYGFKVKKIVKRDDILELKLGNYELLEILTKEQFNQMKYIVGDE